MEVTERQVTKRIIKSDGLDPVIVITDDIEPGKGSIVITCYGKAWTAYWGGMGDKTVVEFFRSCTDDYLSGCLSSVDSMVTDFNKISQDVGEEVDTTTLMLYTERLSELYGDDWWLCLPMASNPTYQYLCRIIKVIQKAFHHGN